jgi:hypothetical protein
MGICPLVRKPTGPKPHWSESPQSEGEKSDSYKRPTCPKARKSDNPLVRMPASPANFPGVATQTPVQASHIRRSLWVAQ